jgi:hypothetical protein
MTGVNPVMFLSNAQFYSAITDLKILSNTSGIIIIGEVHPKANTKRRQIKS